MSKEVVEGNAQQRIALEELANQRDAVRRNVRTDPGREAQLSPLNVVEQLNLVLALVRRDACDKLEEHGADGPVLKYNI